jgi:very-short-patch-repair endonuclease
MRHRDDIRAFAEFAERQNGNITHRQLVDAGFSRDQIQRRCEAGWLIPRHTGVFAVGYVPGARESTWHAGVLALGEGAVLSHTAAAALWGLTRGGAVTEVIVPTTAGHVRRDGILVHRQRLPAAHVTTHRGIPVTTPIRTLLDLAAVASLNALFRAFEQAQVRLHMPPAPLAAEVIARPRRRGNAKLRRVLAGSVDPAAVRSVLELRFLRMCAANGIPRPQVNIKIGIWTPDFLWPEWKLVVETDGYDFHRTAAARRRDARKDEELRSLGLTVVRLTWSDVVERPGGTTERIRRHECHLDGGMRHGGDIRRGATALTAL